MKREYMPHGMCKTPFIQEVVPSIKMIKKLAYQCVPRNDWFTHCHHYDLLLKFVFESGCLNLNAILYGADTVEKIFVNLFQSVP